MTTAERGGRRYHPKAMPVILTTPAEVETWMTAPADEALKLQRLLPVRSLWIVARGVQEDPAGPVGCLPLIAPSFERSIFEVTGLRQE